MCDECRQYPCDRRCPNSQYQDDENVVIRDIDYYQELAAERIDEIVEEERERRSVEEIF